MYNFTPLGESGSSILTIACEMDTDDPRNKDIEEEPEESDTFPPITKVGNSKSTGEIRIETSASRVFNPLLAMTRNVSTGESALLV